MLPTDWEYGDWPKSGEIDIMENVGYDSTRIYSTIHAIGMDTLVKQYFAELSSGVGAVAAALKKYVPEKVTL
jgi:hypothetical protein